MKKIVLCLALLTVSVLSFAQASGPEGLSPMPNDVRAAFLSGKTTGPEVKGLVIVEVGASWCAPCKELSAALQEKDMVTYFKQQGVRFYQRDYDKERNGRTLIGLAVEWNIKSVPTLLFLKDGKEHARMGGFDSKKADETMTEIKKLVQQYK